MQNERFQREATTMELIYNYMKNDGYRHKLNDLTKKTFGFSFESWVVNGYFEGDYIPYSYLEDGKIICNVSANRMAFQQNGVERHYIQIGTVMTDEAYRRQGLAGKLLRYVVEQYEGKCDGIYLFGDLSAVGFYEKAGFRQANEYRYWLKEALLPTEREMGFVPLQESRRAQYLTTVRHSAVYSALEQENKFGLQMFYTASLENVYYHPQLACFAVLEKEGDTLILQSVICKEKLPLQTIIDQLGSGHDRLMLGFAPLAEDRALFEAELYDGGEDYRLFYRGAQLESIEKEKLYFPQLSHA